MVTEVNERDRTLCIWAIDVFISDFNFGLAAFRYKRMAINNCTRTDA